MGKIKWYKRDPDAALSGMMSLTLEERGAYNTLLDLLYTRDGDLPDDDRFLAGWMRCDLRVWKRIKKRLIDDGKISVVDGRVVNFRATSEILMALSRVERAREAGRASAAKSATESRNVSGLPGASVEHDHQLTTTTPTTRISSCAEKGGDLPTPFQAVFDEGCNLYPHLAPKDSAPIHSWLSAGCDVELDIIPTIRRLRGGQSWKYFTRAIMDAKATRETIPPEGTPSAGPARRPGYGETAFDMKQLLQEMSYGPETDAG
jgi:uncharacterized protein YdaU (DUF1376 family)